MNVCSYSRVSTSEQVAHGYSLADQKLALAAYCKAKGYTLIEHIEDAGISGRIQDRPGIRRIWELFKSGSIETVVLLNIKRLSRTNWRAQEQLARFRQAGLRVEFLEHTSGGDPETDLLVGMLGAVGQFEHADIRRKMRAGRYQKAREGKIPSGVAPYGYRLVSVAESRAIPEFKGRDGELLIEESEAEVVRELYRRIAEGEPRRTLCRWLNDAGIRTRRGNLWATTTLRGLILNPVYRGLYRFGFERSEQGDELNSRGNLQVRVWQAEEWVEIAVPAIVDVGVWEQANRRLAEAVRWEKGRYTDRWLLRGLVSCGVCLTERGEPRGCVSWQSNPRLTHRYYRYQCSSRHIPGGFCGTSYNAPKLERIVLEVVRREAQPEVLAKRYREEAKARRRETGNVATTLERLAAALARLDAEERRAADLILAGISSHITAEKIGLIRQRRATLEAQWQEAEKVLAGLEEPEAAARRGEDEAARLRERLARAGEDPEELRKLYQQVVRVILYPQAPPEVRVVPGLT